MKVAHVLRHFEPGGVEKWLLDITRVNKESCDAIELDFITNKGKSFF